LFVTDGLHRCQNFSPEWLELSFEIKERNIHGSKIATRDTPSPLPFI